MKCFCNVAKAYSDPTDLDPDYLLMVWQQQCRPILELEEVSVAGWTNAVKYIGEDTIFIVQLSTKSSIIAEL